MDGRSDRENLLCGKRLRRAARSVVAVGLAFAALGS